MDYNSATEKFTDSNTFESVSINKIGFTHISEITGMSRTLGPWRPAMMTRRTLMIVGTGTHTSFFTEITIGMNMKPMMSRRQLGEQRSHDGACSRILEYYMTLDHSIEDSYSHIYIYAGF
jgi:hypothetical protein